MDRFTTLEQIELLQALVNKGVSPARASVVLKRPKQAVQSKAREIGTPFPDSRLVKAARQARELSGPDVAMGRRRASHQHVLRGEAGSLIRARAVNRCART
jgi:hypothetical protein